MVTVTSGRPYLDIDAYAGCVAYAELLQVLGEQAQFASTSFINESVSPILKAWPVQLLTSFSAGANDTFVIIDTSDPKFFDPIVDVDSVVGVIDHHPGFENYWKDKLGEAAHIEFIGAACTLVFEAWQEAGKLDAMSQTSARLLLCGILDNTFNFGAEITTERDKLAYQELFKRANLSEDWPARYFADCQTKMMADLPTAIVNDCKVINFKSFEGTLKVGQLVAWDARALLDTRIEEIATTMGNSMRWMVNIVSITDGRSYILTPDSEVQAWASKLLDVSFHGDLGVAQRMWLRKEILRADLLQLS